MTDQQIWKWTLTKEAIAPCFVRDVLAMRQSTDRGPSTYSPFQRTHSRQIQTPTFSGSDIRLVGRFSSSPWSSPFKSTTSALFTPVGPNPRSHSPSTDDITTSRRWNCRDRLCTSSPSTCAPPTCTCTAFTVSIHGRSEREDQSPTLPAKETAPRYGQI